MGVADNDSLPLERLSLPPLPPAMVKSRLPFHLIFFELASSEPLEFDTAALEVVAFRSRRTVACMPEMSENDFGPPPAAMVEDEKVACFRPPGNPRIDRAKNDLESANRLREVTVPNFDFPPPAPWLAPRA